MKEILVSIIIINYNGENIIEKCIKSTLLQSYNPIEIIVIDNNSTDKSMNKLYKYKKKVKIIQSNKNIGCPGARNLGLKYVNGDYIAFLDNDGFPDKNWIKNGIKKMSNPKIGAIAPLVLFEKNKDIINGIGGTITKYGYGKDIFYKLPLRNIKKFPDYALYPMGCGMIIRADILKKNKFDEILFNYYDDTDMGIKIWSKGYLIATEPNSIVYHLMSESEKHNQNKIFLCERNRVYTFLKYLPLKNLFIWAIKEVIIEVIRFNPEFFTIWIWNIKNIKRIRYYRKKFNTKFIFPKLRLNKLIN